MKAQWTVSAITSSTSANERSGRNTSSAMSGNASRATNNATIDTSRGVISDREARQRKLGGEVLCELW